jgi:hypothetical protein
MTRPIQTNAADENQVKEADRSQKRQREQQLEDLRTVMKTPEGRRVLFWLINKVCHYDANDFNHSGSITNFSLGERNVGRILKGDACEASYELYQLAERENWKFLKGDK